MGAGRTASSPGRSLSTDQAIASLHEKFPLNDQGYFGSVGKRGDESIRQITSGDPQATFEEFAQKITRGASIDESVKPTDGVSYLHPDGTRINIRQTSQSRSPAIDIVSGNSKMKDQKIHFEGVSNG